MSTGYARALEPHTRSHASYGNNSQRTSTAGSNAVHRQNEQEYMENGRYYCTFRKGSYMYPCDEVEKIRMDMLHDVMLAIRPGLHSATIQSKHDVRILDLGTGTGIWAIDMADKYPHAEVVGIDFANIQPATIPKNLRFSIGVDYQNPWSLGEDSWDLIHLRGGLGSVDSWPALYQKVFNHLKPGVGSFEQVEVDLRPRSDDGTLPEAPMVQWYEYLDRATRECGRPIEYQQNIKEMLERQGFVDIEEQVYKAPFNTWPRDQHLKMVARRYCGCLIQWMEALSLQPMTKAFRWRASDIRPLLNHVTQTLLNKKIHGYHNVHIWTARRPSP